MANVLLVSIYYAPELTGIGINNAAMTRSLIREGHCVEIVTGLPHFPEWIPHPAYRHIWRATEQIDGAVVHRFRHAVPRRHNAITRAVYEVSFGLHAATAMPRRQPDAVIAVVPPLASGYL